MNATHAIARYGELWLKGKNKSQFVQRLKTNIQGAFKAAGIGPVKLTVLEARMGFEPKDPTQIDQIVALIRDTPGFANVSAAVKVAPTLEAMNEAACTWVRENWLGQIGTYVVRARRSDKRFPMQAPELEQAVAFQVGLVLGWRADMKNATHTLLLEVFTDAAYVSPGLIQAVGGLPVGTAGSVMLLLSGGLDSPVAGFLAQKRGCNLEAVYFHSPPYISEAAREKVVALARVLATRQHGLRLHVVPFTHIQEAIKASCNGKFTVLLYRRFMYRISAAIARRAGSLALCTGENLGQVASQTLDNLQVLDVLTGMLTLRPLITADKMETTELARRIGTFGISILPAEDCCSLFVPRHPAVKSTVSQLAAEESKLDIDALVETSLQTYETVLV